MESSLGCSRGQRVVGPAHRLGQWQRVEVSEGPAPAWLSSDSFTQHHKSSIKKVGYPTITQYHYQSHLAASIKYSSSLGRAARPTAVHREVHSSSALLLLLQALPQGGRRVGGLLHLGYAGRGEADRALRGAADVDVLVHAELHHQAARLARVLGLRAQKALWLACSYFGHLCHGKE